MKTCIFEFFDDKIGKMFECNICSKLTTFNSFLKNYVTILIFFVDKFCWNICFLTKSLFRITKFCCQVVKFEWRAPKVWASFSRPNVRHTLWQRRHRKDLTLLISFRERIISKFVISITKTSKQNRDPKFPFSISWCYHGWRSSNI